MTALLMPFMFTICLLALGSAALNCRGHFAYPAFAPIILNVFLIVGAKWLAPMLADEKEGQFFVIGISLLGAGVIQLAGVVWLLRRANLAIAPRLRPVLPEVRRIGAYVLPMLIPLGAVQLTTFLDRYLAMKFTEIGSRPLEPGIVRCLYPASRLYMLPMGVLAIPIATVIFPLLGRYASRNDSEGLRDTTNRALRLCLFLSVPAALALILIAEDAVAVLFQRDQFGPSDTRRAALILRMYCLGLWAYFFNQVLLRAFFAVGKPRKPMTIALILSPLNVLLVVLGIHTGLKGGAIGLATALTQSINALLLIYLLRAMWGRIGFTSIIRSLLKIVAASAAMGGVLCAGLKYLRAPLDDILRDILPAWAGQIAVLAAVVFLAGAVYLAVSLILRCEEIRELAG
jgi:putative peptidoglycan lipid II flippase